MKHRATFVKLFIFITCFCLFAISCKKEEIPGPKGEPGTPGGGGNASISKSDIFTITSTQWKANSGSSAWVVSITSTLITQSAVDNGAVKVFSLRNSAWWELPLTQGDLFTQFGFVLGSVNLEYLDIHGGLPDKPLTSQYRIVVLSESARTMAIPNTSEDMTINELSN